MRVAMVSGGVMCAQAIKPLVSIRQTVVRSFVPILSVMVIVDPQRLQIRGGGLRISVLLALAAVVNPMLIWVCIFTSGWIDAAVDY